MYGRVVADRLHLPQGSRNGSISDPSSKTIAGRSTPGIFAADERRIPNRHTGTGAKDVRLQQQEGRGEAKVSKRQRRILGRL